MASEARSAATALLPRLGTNQTPTTAEREQLFALVYGELHRLAVAMMSNERRAVTLQPTALVHEVYLQLVDRPADWEGRSHFLHLAARCMRHVLVDHARARGAAKRGGNRRPVTLDEGLLAAESRDVETLMLNDVLDKLAALDARAAQVAEMRLFGGMSVKEIAEALDVSKRTVDGDWATARLWLSRELRSE